MLPARHGVAVNLHCFVFAHVLGAGDLSSGFLLAVLTKDMTRYLKQNAVCVINCSWDVKELEQQLPAKMRRDLAEKKARACWS